MECDYDDLQDGIYNPVGFRGGTVCLGYGDENNLGQNCKILTRPEGICDDKQVGATMVGPVASMARVCRSCGCNAHNAICNRHGAKAPEFNADFQPWYEAFEPHREIITGDYVAHFQEHADAWIDRWPEGKRKAIRESQIVDVIVPDKVKCMVKREVGPKDPTKARGIQFYTNLATQAEYAPETASLQKAYCGYFNRKRIGNCRITFSSGMNAKMLGEWAEAVLLDYNNPWFYERDGKNWDSTMGPKHHAVKMHAYKGVGADYCAFMERAAKVKGYGVYQNEMLRYSLDYTTKSGHNDTTLGNNIVNAAITWCVFQDRECDIIIAGDDLLVVVEGDFDEHAIAEQERKFGIIPEYRKFRSLEDSSYISGLFARTDMGMKFIAKPGRLLQQLFWTVKPPGLKPAKLRAYQRGVAKGVVPTMGCVPVVGPWLRAIGDEGETIADKSRRTYIFGEGGDADFTAWFKRRYECTDKEIKEVEDLLSEAGTARCFIKHRLIDHIVEVDRCDIGDRDENGDWDYC